MAAPLEGPPDPAVADHPADTPLLPGTTLKSSHSLAHLEDQNSWPQGKGALASNGSAPGLHCFEIMSDEDAASSHGVPPAFPSDAPSDGLLQGRRGDGAALHGPPGISPRKRTYMVSMFCLVAALLYADQNLMAPNLTAIAEDFGFDDNERDKYLGGYIAAAFYMVGAPAALLFGYLSDTVNRRNLLFVAVLLGEGPCIMTYFVTEYWQLLVLRLLTGISLGGTFPLVFSLLGDLFDPSKRAAIAAVVQLATGIGLAVGQGIAGFVGSSIGWRWPFVIVAVPSILVALVMVLTTEEPTRGATEHALQQQFDEGEGFVYSERISWSKVWLLVRIPTNVLVIAQGLFGCLPWGMLLTFLNDFLSQNKGMSVPVATTVVLMVGAGGAVGVVGGGIVGQWLYNQHSKRSMPIFIGLSTILGAVPLWVIINAPVGEMKGLAFVMALLTGALSSTVGPNMRAMMLNVNEPETRGIALALQTMLDDLGKGLGPALVAVLISQVGRSTAFNVSAAGWVPCGLLLLGTAFTLERDEQRMQRRLHTVVSQMLLSARASSARLAEVDRALDEAFAADDEDEDLDEEEGGRGGKRSSFGGSRSSSRAALGKGRSGSFGGSRGSSRARLKLGGSGGEGSSVKVGAGLGVGAVAGPDAHELQRRLLTLSAEQEEEGAGAGTPLLLQAAEPTQPQQPPNGDAGHGTGKV